MATFGAWLGEQAGRGDEVGKLGEFWKNETGHGKIRSVAGIQKYLAEGQYEASWEGTRPVLDAAVTEFRRTGGLSVVPDPPADGPPGRTIDQEAARRAAEAGRAERMDEIHQQLGITPGQQAQVDLAGPAGQETGETAAQRWERIHGRELMPTVDAGEAVQRGMDAAAAAAAAGEMPVNPEAEARRALALRSVAAEAPAERPAAQQAQLEPPGVLELSGAALDGGTEPGTLALWTGEAWVSVGAAAPELLTAVRAVTRTGRVRPVTELDAEASADPERDRYLAMVEASGEGLVLPPTYMPEVFHYDLGALYAAADHTAGIVD